MISVWDKESNAQLKENQAKEGFVTWKKDGQIYERYYYFYEKEELARILEEIGFKIIKILSQKEEVSKHSKKNFIFYVQKN
jgi:hypothetical protein